VEREEFLEALEGGRTKPGVVLGRCAVVDLQGPLDAGWMDLAVGHCEGGDELGEVVAERCERQVVGVDGENRSVAGEQEVPGVAVLVERSGSPAGFSSSVSMARSAAMLGR
jgi:hypothetical protein